jgi:hypothetical protein
LTTSPNPGLLAREERDMNQTAALGLLIAWTVLLGIIIGLAQQAVSRGRALAAQSLLRLSRVEAKVDTLLKHARIEFDESQGAPPGVAAAIAQGRTIEAIKLYRAASGLGLAEAKERVDELKRQMLG